MEEKLCTSTNAPNSKASGAYSAKLPCTAMARRRCTLPLSPSAILSLFGSALSVNVEGLNKYDLFKSIFSVCLIFS